MIEVSCAAGRQSLPDWSFSYCSELRFVEIPKSVCFIGYYCFCPELTEVVFEAPATVERIAAEAFFDCTELISFTVPFAVSTLSNRVFDGCSKLSSMAFDAPSQVTTIPSGLFICCKCLTTLALPDSVTDIYSSAFDDSGVTSIIGSDWIINADLVVRRGKVFCGIGITIEYQDSWSRS
jgi:hypothetical protein